MTKHYISEPMLGLQVDQNKKKDAHSSVIIVAKVSLQEFLKVESINLVE
jgi:hypothetical protein